MCRVDGSGRFKCGWTGHISIDCIATATTNSLSDLICFHLNKRGHKKANCLSLAGRVVATPALMTLEITNGCLGKANALLVRNRAFQLLAEEARTIVEVVTDMYLSLISFISLMFMLIIYI